MSLPLATPDVLQTPKIPPVARVGAMSRFMHNPLGVISTVLLIVIVVVAVLAPWIVPHDPAKPLLDQVNSAPNSVYWLGGDGSGRDILSRLMMAAQLTLFGTLVVAVVALVVGVGGGLVAGYLGGWADASLNWTYNAILAVPSIIILVALYAAIGPNTLVTMAAFGVLISPILFRLVRTLVLAVRQELYVDAARVSGLGEGRIMVRHVLTAVRAPVIVACAGVAGAGIMIQAGLAFLGLGSPSQPTWGGMLQDAFQSIFRAPLNVLWPGLAIGITTASLALLANALRDALEDTDAQAGNSSAARSVSSAYVYPARSEQDDAAPAGTLLSIEGLAIGYPTASGEPKVVVDGVSLHIARGEVLGLVGESGSGKTQVALAALGLLPSQARVLSGRIIFDGEDLRGATEKHLTSLRGSRIAYVPQEPMSNLDPTYTVGYQLVVPMIRRLGLDKRTARVRALDLLYRVGIADPARTMRS
ncbi:MAG: ABC transporter permease subunit, partial [Mycetocola sp.]